MTSSPDLTRVRDHVTSAVQPTLDFLNAYFGAAADGSLRALTSVAFKAASFAGNLTVNNANLTVAGGKTFLQNATGQADVLTVVPTIAGQAMKITNVSNTAIVMGVQADGTTYATTFISGNGFPSVLDAGQYWNSNAAANTQYQTQKSVVNTNGLAMGLTPFVYKFPRAGSIVGYSLNQAGAVAGGNLLQYLRNGTALGVLNVGTGNNGAAFWNTHGKGAYPFAAGDTLTVTTGNTAAGNLQASILITIELSA